MGYRTKDIDIDARRDPQTNHFCARCHRDLKVGQPYKRIHMVDGGPFALHKDDEDKYNNPAADMGWWPVGLDCAKKIGADFVWEK